jgi:hypothetical protein
LRKAVLDELLADRPELATEVIKALVLRLRERADAGADDSAMLE